MKNTILILLFAGFTSLCYADWTANGWTGNINTNWQNWNNSSLVGEASVLTAAERLKSVIVSSNFSSIDTQTKFHILTTYFGNDFADVDHVIRSSVSTFMSGSSVDVEQFRILTGNGDPQRVALAVKSLWRYAKEKFIERDLVESMRANALYLFFLSFGSAENLNTAGTSFSNDVFGEVGGATKAMRTARKSLIDGAVVRNKNLLAKNGKPFVGEGKLILANALVEALKTGNGVVEALGELGVFIDASAYNSCKSVANLIKLDILQGGMVNEPRLTMLEVYLGVQGFNEFIQSYNVQNQ